MDKNTPIISKLPKTWIIDLDGVIFTHNKYLSDKPHDNILPGSKEFFKKINRKDLIIIITARNIKFRKYTVNKLRRAGIRFNYLIMAAPTGERIIINDKKPSGLKTALALNLDRDLGLAEVKFITDKNL
jgi:hypothetical protein